MFVRPAQHAGDYRPFRDDALALAAQATGRHAAGPAEPVDVTLAELHEPVVPPAGFPGFPSVVAR